MIFFFFFFFFFFSLSVSSEPKRIRERRGHAEQRRAKGGMKEANTPFQGEAIITTIIAGYSGPARVAVVGLLSKLLLQRLLLQLLVLLLSDDCAGLG